MPSGNGLAIGAGIAQGADNFLRSFLAARQMKEQNKYRKLEPIIGVAMAQINNPDISLDEKIAAIDALPHILGIKNQDMPLSKQLGLDRLAEQMADTGETKNVNTQTGTIAKKTLKSPMIGIDGQPIGEQETTTPESPLFGTKQAPVLARRGSLSESDIKLARQLKIVDHTQFAQFDREKQLAVLHAELQDKVLSRQGWEKEGDWVLDTNSKQWGRIWTNPRTKETFTQSLPPDVVPEKIIQEQVKGRSGGKESMIVRTLTDYYTGQGQDYETAHNSALKDFQTNYQAGTTFKQQGVAGTRSTDIRGNEGINLQKLAIQQKHSELVANAGASKANVDSLAARKTAAWANVQKTLDIFKQAEKDYDPDEKEYQTAQADYDKATATANDLETQYQNAAKAHSALTDQVNLSEQNLKNSGISPSASSQNLTPKQKAYVDQYFGGDVQKAIEYNQSKGKVFP